MNNQRHLEIAIALDRIRLHLGFQEHILLALMATAKELAESAQTGQKVREHLEEVASRYRNCELIIRKICADIEAQYLPLFAVEAEPSAN